MNNKRVWKIKSHDSTYVSCPLVPSAVGQEEVLDAGEMWAEGERSSCPLQGRLPTADPGEAVRGLEPAGNLGEEQGPMILWAFVPAGDQEAT